MTIYGLVVECLARVQNEPHFPYRLQYNYDDDDDDGACNSVAVLYQ